MLQAVTDSVQFAFGEANPLPVDLGIGIVRTDELPASPNGEGFEHFVEGVFVVFSLAEVFPEIGDPRGEQRLPIVTRDQPQLVIQIKDRVVDWGSREQDDLLIQVPLGDDPEEVGPTVCIRVAEVVAFVHDNNPKAGVLVHGEVAPADPLHRDDFGRDGVLAKQRPPDGFGHRGRADDQRCLPLAVCVVVEQAQGQVRLAQADRVRNQHATVVLDDFLCCQVAVMLKVCQRDGRGFLVLLSEFLIQFIPQSLIDNFDVNLVRGIRAGEAL